MSINMGYARQFLIIVSFYSSKFGWAGAITEDSIHEHNGKSTKVAKFSITILKYISKQI